MCQFKSCSNFVLQYISGVSPSSRGGGAEEVKWVGTLDRRAASLIPEHALYPST